MFNPDRNVSPFNRLPPLAILAALAMAAVEIAIELGAKGYIGGPQAVGWRLDLLNRFAISGPLVEWMLVDTHRFTFGILIRFVTYPFIHGSFSHMAFAAVFTLALGKFVGEVFSALALALVWLGSAIVAALAHVALTSSGAPLFGGMPPAYGLIGAFTFLLMQRARATGQSPAVAFRLIGVLLLLNLAFGAVGGGFDSQIVSRLAGFAAGFALSFVLAPGGWTQTRALLRRR